MWRALLRLFFRLLYNDFAWSYDPVARLVSRGQWIAWGESTLPHVEGDRILELGHGPGHLLSALSESGRRPIGIDVSRAMTRQARRRLDHAHPNIPVAQADARSIPFKRGVFNSIVATFPTDFIFKPETLREVIRVLTSEGRLIIALGVRFEGQDRVSRFLAWLYRMTGQSEPYARLPVSLLEAWGLSAEIAWKPVGDASVMILIGDKVQ